MGSNIDKLHARYNAKLERLDQARQEARDAKRELDQALESHRRDEVLASLGLGPRADVEAGVETQVASVEAKEAGDGE